MKAIYFYLKARLTGKPISWTQAKVEAERISILNNLDEFLDKFCLRIVGLYTFIKNIVLTKGIMPLDNVVQKLYKLLVQSFLGRLLLCFCKGKTNYRFLFKGLPS